MALADRTRPGLRTFQQSGMWLNTTITRSVKKWQNAMNTDEPLLVTQEAVDAYEKRSGFYGIGKKMVEHGHWKIVTQEEVSCTQ